MNWISVKYGLPEDNSQVLVCDDGYIDVVLCDYNSTYFNQAGFWIHENGGEYMIECTKVKYWMYLPEKPE